MYLFANPGGGRGGGGSGGGMGRGRSGRDMGLVGKTIRIVMGPYKVCLYLPSFPGSRAGEEEREPGTHCSRMRQVSLVTCILLRCTKITVQFCLPAERLHCMIILLLRLIRTVFKSKTISLRQ